MAGSSLTEFGQETSIGGVRYVTDVSSRNLRRFFWFLVVCTALGALTFQIVNICTAYIARPVSVNREYIPMGQMKFPAVTICNYNQIRKTGLLEAFGYSHGDDVIKTAHAIMSPSPETMDQDVNLVGLNANYDFEYLMTTVGHKKDEMIMRCKWPGRQCSADNFTTTYASDSICVTFNSGESGDIIEQANGGERYGLTVYLDVESQEYVDNWQNFVGFRVIVHDQDDKPNMKDKGFNVAPGTYTAAALKKLSSSYLKEPFGHTDCIDSPRGALNYFLGNYSLAKCKVECETDYAIKECQCRYYTMPGDAPVCNVIQLHHCYVPKMAKFTDVQGLCSHCKTPCYEESYGEHLSYALFPSGPSVEELAEKAEKPCPKAMALYYKEKITAYVFASLSMANLSKILITTKDKLLDAIFLGETHISVDRIINDITASAPEGGLLPLVDVTDSPIENDQLTVGKLYEILTEALQSYYDQIYSEISIPLSSNLYRYIHSERQSSVEVGGDIYRKVYETTINSSASARRLKKIAPDLAVQGTFRAALNVTDSYGALVNDTKYALSDAFTDIFDLIYTTVLDTFEENRITALENHTMYQICMEYMRENTLELRVYFNEMREEKITQQQYYEPFNLICDIGGTLGLFFGASLLSVIEIIDFLLFRRCAKIPSQKTEPCIALETEGT
ncbi:acid-sensing ion channel 2-like isoform X2 [Ptychodera flava]|uniref:acid-sensing ion channel 2-like isoform X2 n=1 Tax=Ptychodera flava TaxID=63121 RepID=UPI003969E4CA